MVELSEVRKFYAKYKKVVERNIEYLSHLSVAKVLIGECFFTLKIKRGGIKVDPYRLIYSMTAESRYLAGRWFEVKSGYTFDEALEGLIDLLQARLDKLNEEEQRRKNTSTVTITIGGRRRRRGGGEVEWF